MPFACASYSVFIIMKLVSMVPFELGMELTYYSGKSNITKNIIGWDLFLNQEYGKIYIMINYFAIYFNLIFVKKYAFN